ncbi:glutamine--fructose-6-phosphate transaminase (isomerizing) [Actinopolymorpha sp. B9G3]|uniref:glutamine--fructose-6-phosphate transaminase (isomerizing) n=1 Tax=Actinopolymorpha sp. B9G3 TaxID=3158970 RepID=UPI0032D9569A
MCGIVGYVGSGSASSTGAGGGQGATRGAVSVVVDGLRRLEYRGYDSAGVAVPDGRSVRVSKRAGKLANLQTALAEEPLPASRAAMGHTRWATHGAPTDPNAHPHIDCHGKLAVVHNGIIENFAALRTELTESGHHLTSETDTETVAHLLEDACVACGGDLAAAMRRVCRRLDGAFTLVAIHADTPDLVVGARRNSPLVVGRGEGENFLASDVAAFIEHTREAIELGQDHVVAITASDITVTDFDGEPVKTREFHVDWDISAAEKGGYEYFMLKEIAEQPKAVADALLGRLAEDGRLRLDDMRLTDDEIREIDKIIIIACGSAFYAGMTAKYAIEHWTRIPCEVELSSEFRYRDPIVSRSTLVVAISQSGETMDTLMALRHAREQRARVLAICNTNGSTIPRESDAVLYTHAGPEVGVAATKTFLTQVVACYLMGLYLAQVRESKFGDEVSVEVDQLDAMPAAVEQALGTMGQVRALAQDLAGAKSVLFIGRHVGYPVALEGALKLKELAYMHAEAFAAGELKHGPIALIEDGLPVVVVVPPRGRDALHDKIVSNIQEIRARGARTIVLAEEGDLTVEKWSDVLIRLPKVPTLLQPLVATVPLQIFACELAMARGNDVDQPRNLAKSVTVE